MSSSRCNLVILTLALASSSQQMESELIRNLIYVFQGIDGDMIKFNTTKSCYEIVAKVRGSKLL